MGLLFALFGIAMAVATGDGRWDGVGALAIGLLLLIIAIFLAVEMSSMLVGESAVPEQTEAIRQALAAQPMVNRVIHLRTLHVGPDELLVAAKIATDPHQSAADLADAINEAEVNIRAAVPEATYIFIEPDIDRGA